MKQARSNHIAAATRRKGLRHISTLFLHWNVQLVEPFWFVYGTLGFRGTNFGKRYASSFLFRAPQVWGRNKQVKEKLADQREPGAKACLCFCRERSTKGGITIDSLHTRTHPVPVAGQAEQCRRHRRLPPPIRVEATRCRRSCIAIVLSLCFVAFGLFEEEPAERLRFEPCRSHRAHFQLDCLAFFAQLRGERRKRRTRSQSLFSPFRTKWLLWNEARFTNSAMPANVERERRLWTHPVAAVAIISARFELWTRFSSGGRFHRKWPFFLSKLFLFLSNHTFEIMFLFSARANSTLQNRQPLPPLLPARQPVATLLRGVFQIDGFALSWRLNVCVSKQRAPRLNVKNPAAIDRYRGKHCNSASYVTGVPVLRKVETSDPALPTTSQLCSSNYDPVGTCGNGCNDSNSGCLLSRFCLFPNHCQ